jgi:hypothetical protein
MIYFKFLHNQMNTHSIAVVFMCLFFSAHTFDLDAQQRNTQLKVYGHLQYSYDDLTDAGADSYFSLGEQDFFVTSNLSDQISFLGETVVRYDNATASKFAPSIERAQFKYDYYKNHSLIVGKMHTPVNYWNDVYHHGRLFYPTIDRPTSFSYMIPLHSLGARAQGQNLGKLNFGYDVSATNSIASTDVFDSSLNKSITAALHIKPIEGMRIGGSYYNDYMSSNTPGAHTGHGSGNPAYKGAVNFEIACFSFAYFGEHLEVLSESAYNRNRTDSLGVAENYSQFVYAGLRFKEKHVAYGLFDFMDMSEKELHTVPINVVKLGLGYKWDILYNCVLKIQLERLESGDDHLFHNHNSIRYDFRCQLAYGF